MSAAALLLPSHPGPPSGAWGWAIGALLFLLLAVALRAQAPAAPPDADNYDITLDPGGEGETVALRLRPKRRDVLLVDGAVHVKSDDGDLVRIEGMLAKGPSFWTPRVHIVREYARLAGMRVPVRLDTRSQVRLAGPSQLHVTYTYELLNGVPVPRDTAH